MLKAFKRIREYDKNFLPYIENLGKFWTKTKKKIQIPNHLSKPDRMGQKTSHATVPLKGERRARCPRKSTK
jgi:hypothetical protein